VGLFLGFLFGFIGLCVCFYDNHVGLVTMALEIRYYDASSFAVLLRIALAY
jgi:hypothetical protein